jgi:hypothetical protein
MNQTSNPSFPRVSGCSTACPTIMERVHAWRQDASAGQAKAYAQKFEPPRPVDDGLDIIDRERIHAEQISRGKYERLLARQAAGKSFAVLPAADNMPAYPGWEKTP